MIRKILNKRALENKVNLISKRFSQSILIKSGVIVNSEDKFSGDILIKNGKIDKIFRTGANQNSNDSVLNEEVKVINAENNYIIPGGIDTHTHMELSFMRTTAIDDFNTGSKAAIAGGTTSFLDFMIPDKGESLIKAYEKWRSRADQKVNCDYSLHCAITEWNEDVKREMAEIVKLGVSSFKVFLAYKGSLMLNDQDFLRVLERTKELGALCMVHAENGELLYDAQQKLLKMGVTGPEGHYLSRPEIIEANAVNKVVTYSEISNAPLYVVHVMSKEAADNIIWGRSRGNIIFAETLAAALGVDGRKYFNKDWEIAAGHVMSPPLNPDPSTKTHLMKMLLNNAIQTVGTDNCTFCTSQKKMGLNDFTKIPNGVNGIEDRLSIVWTKGVKTGLLSPSDFVRVTSTAAARLFNLYPRKGIIKEGADADLVIWNGEKERVISTKTHHQAVDFNVFEGMKVKGTAELTMVNGKILWRNGKFTDNLIQGSGRFIERKPFGFAFERVKDLDNARDPRKFIVDRDTTTSTTTTATAAAAAEKTSTSEIDHLKDEILKLKEENHNLKSKVLSSSPMFDSNKRFISVENSLEQLSGDKQSYSELMRILYGQKIEILDINQEAKNLSSEHNFEIKGFKIKAEKEQLRPERIVRIGAIQNSIVLPTTDSVKNQKQAILDRIYHIITAAYHSKVNVICMDECWNAPFFMCTREKLPWTEFAESVKDGDTTKLLQELAKKYNMVIINPILERDDVREVFWNTAVVIDNNGRIQGKAHKMHIPRVGDFNESSYYMEGETGFPVFKTDFGLIGINICYGRHHPLQWMALGFNGAEVVFNPSSTVSGLSEHLWPIEARNAAIANSYFSVAINRVGTEIFPYEFTSGDGKPAHKDFGHFFGSSFITAPEGTRTPGLSRVSDGLLISEIDLNMCRQTKDKWSYQMTARYQLYAELLTKYATLNYKRQIL